MVKIKLIKAHSYNGIVKATREKPIVEAEDEAAQALVATGYFEYCTPSAPAPDADNDAGSDDGVPDYEALSEMTKAELTAYATENDIDIAECKTKADILEAISVANGGSRTMIDIQED